MIQINVKIADTGGIEVGFDKHFTKRDLLRVIKAIKVQYRESVRNYHREQRNIPSNLGEILNGKRNEQSGQSGTGTEIRAESDFASRGSDRPETARADEQLRKADTGLADAIKLREAFKAKGV